MTINLIYVSHLQGPASGERLPTLSLRHQPSYFSLHPLSARGAIRPIMLHRERCYAYQDISMQYNGLLQARP